MVSLKFYLFLLQAILIIITLITMYFEVKKNTSAKAVKINLFTLLALLIVTGIKSMFDKDYFIFSIALFWGLVAIPTKIKVMENREILKESSNENN